MVVYMEGVGTIGPVSLALVLRKWGFDLIDHFLNLHCKVPSLGGLDEDFQSLRIISLSFTRKMLLFFHQSTVILGRKSNRDGLYLIATQKLRD